MWNDSRRLWKVSVSKFLSYLIIAQLTIIEKGHNHFEVLPEGWVQITHTSGIPVYLQRKTRVVSVSRPYYLGPGSARVRLYFYKLEKSL